MTVTPRKSRRSPGYGRVAGTVLAGSLVAAGMIVGSALPASAHDYLVDSTPTAGQTLVTLPAEFSVTANANVLDLAGDGTGFGIQVTDAAGAFYGDGCLTIAGPTVSTLASLGEAGNYLFTWQIVSSDGHPVSDTLSFTWAPEAGFEAATGLAAAPVCGVTAPEPDPTATVGPVPEPTMSISAGDDDAAGTDTELAEGNADALWIGGGILAVLLAVGITLYAVRRKGGETTTGSGSESESNSVE
jgi:methionine-rich copper-binding protein CopC